MSVILIPSASFYQARNSPGHSTDVHIHSLLRPLSMARLRILQGGKLLPKITDGISSSGLRKIGSTASRLVSSHDSVRDLMGALDSALKTLWSTITTLPGTFLGQVDSRIAKRKKSVYRALYLRFVYEKKHQQAHLPPVTIYNNHTRMSRTG